VMMLNINWPNQEMLPVDLLRFIISIPDTFILNSLYTYDKQRQVDM
jgi:hypothetical protein